MNSWIKSLAGGAFALPFCVMPAVADERVLADGAAALVLGSRLGRFDQVAPGHYVAKDNASIQIVVHDPSPWRLSRRDRMGMPPGRSQDGSAIS